MPIDQRGKQSAKHQPPSSCHGRVVVPRPRPLGGIESNAPEPIPGSLESEYGPAQSEAQRSSASRDDDGLARRAAGSASRRA